MKKVAILIPHFNNPQGLLASLCSINENKPVDVVIVDDGSSEIFDVQRLHKLKNINIIPLYLKHNKGIEHALNYGLKYLVMNNYKYMARLDCGDLCCKGRIEKQKNILLNNEYMLVGSYASFIDLNGKEEFVYKVPKDYSVICKKMYLKVMFIHPSIMINLDIINEIGFYPTEYIAAEDYAYFFKIINKFKATNIEEVLVKCEVNSRGISSRKRRVQLISKLILIKKNFYLGFYPILGFIYTLILFLIPQNLILSIKRNIKLSV